MSRQTRLTGSFGRLSLNKERNSVESVLFVCLGNIIRSPLCEGLLRKRTNGQIHVDSAAVFADNVNENPTGNAQIIAKEHGFDISGHVSRVVTKRDFERFDLIVSLEPRVQRRLEKIRPKSSRSHVMELTPGMTVSNPVEQPLPRFAVMYAQIEKGIAALISKHLPEYTDGA